MGRYGTSDAPHIQTQRYKGDFSYGNVQCTELTRLVKDNPP